MYVERDLEEHFISVSKASKMVALVGARQAGKTTFLKEKSKEYDANYVMFDDPDAREMFEKDIKKFEVQYVNGHEIAVLDEVQYCRNAGPKLKYLVDRGHKMWATSSSEVILAKDVLSHLVGRVSVVRLYPFSFAEYSRARGQKTMTGKIRERFAWEHMTYGGYPEIVLAESAEMKQILLKSLYETMILKDVARTFSIDDMEALEKCVRYFAETVSGVVSYQNASNKLDVSYPTLKKYIDALEKSYLVYQVKPFFTNKVKEITKQPKVYFLDTGMRNIIADDFPSEPGGDLFENYVLTELLKMGHQPNYWRSKSKAEVDFIVKKGKKVVPLEVKIRSDVGKITRSLRSFIERYEPKEAYVVAYQGEEGEMEVNGCTVKFVDVVGMEKELEK